MNANCKVCGKIQDGKGESLQKIKIIAGEHVCGPSAGEGAAVRSQVQGQPEPHSETLTQQKNHFHWQP